MPNARLAKVKVTFSHHAPEAESVAVAGDFTGWESEPAHLKKLKSGLWKGTVSLPPGSYEYRLLVNGQWADDPDCAHRVPNSFGGQNCVRVVA
jgi:5'-AMP-activated protein kinase regulatory beta subunit